MGELGGKGILSRDLPRRRRVVRTWWRRTNWYALGGIVLSVLAFQLVPPGDGVVEDWDGKQLVRLYSENSDGVQRSCSGPAISYAFMHLHKTGGNHLKRLLSGWCKRNDLKAFETCRPAKPESFIMEWLFWRRKNPLMDYDCNLDEFVQLSQEQRDSYDMVLGHMHYGLQLHLSEKPAKYFTFMREPVERKVSHFGHFEHRHGNATDTQEVLNSAWTSELHKYLVTQNLNYMTKRVGMVGAGKSEVYKVLKAKLVDSSTYAADELLREAKMHLVEDFFFVGLYEKYKESCCILVSILNQACFGDRKPDKFHLKIKKLVEKEGPTVSSASRRAQSLQDEVRQHALQAERLDAELYELAKVLFEEKLKIYPFCRIQTH